MLMGLSLVSSFINLNRDSNSSYKNIQFKKNTTLKVFGDKDCNAVWFFHCIKMK